MEFVLDASVAMAWIFPDEKSSHADKILAQVGPDTVLWAPALWWYEVANTIVVGRRSNRLSEAQAAQALETLGEFPIRLGEPLRAFSAARLSMLAHQHSLTAHDAAYLELAESRGAPLATLDKNLIRAARQAGVDIL